jgi:hypothetical protein
MVVPLESVFKSLICGKIICIKDNSDENFLQLNLNYFIWQKLKLFINKKS